jgi:diketogulonate reductase-like aldo/keto reductase
MATVDRYVVVEGVQIPRLIYGTAWKEDGTARLVGLALEAGFRGIDTANQRRHYHEAQVGQAVTNAVTQGLAARDELFVQTKFTYVNGQDARLPYDPHAPLAEQVEQSFASSLEHLGLDRIDSYMLHGPSRRQGLGADDHEVWAAMERLHAAGQAQLLGVSNVTAEQLQELCEGATVKPAVVQNRCYAAMGWDREVRQYCARAGIVYQGFSLLTANPQVLHDRSVTELASRLGKTVEQTIFRFALEVGMVALTGTTSVQHMGEDLDILDCELGAEAVATVENLLS